MTSAVCFMDLRATYKDNLLKKLDRLLDSAGLETVIHKNDLTALVSISHFKGHEFTGFGGTLKNIGMGCASRRGKLAQHATVSPAVNRKKCVGCGDCISRCPAEAIALTADTAVIDAETCIGCGQCIIVCSNNAVKIRWDQDAPLFMEKMVEYAYGAVKDKKHKTLFVNFLTDISPACDCPPYNDAPIVRDIGILASRDPVAVDQASADLVNNESGLKGSVLKDSWGAGEDKFKGMYPEVDWKFQLDYAESLGLGTRQYELTKV